MWESSKERGKDRPAREEGIEPTVWTKVAPAVGVVEPACSSVGPLTGGATLFEPGRHIGRVVAATLRHGQLRTAVASWDRVLYLLWYAPVGQGSRTFNLEHPIG